MYYGGGRSSYGKNLSYNYTSDLSLSSLSPRNPSIQRVINTDYGIRDRSLSPSRDYSPSRGLSSPTFRRRDFGETERSSPASFSNEIDYSIKPRSYYDFPSTSSIFSSYSSPIKKPRRTDYSDYFRPVLSTRPMLKSGYSPRSRTERESVSTPLTRERKLIKFREVPDEVLDKIRRKISWDLPEEISSPLIDEMKQKYAEPVDDSSVPEQSSSRRGSKDSAVSPISGSPRLSLSRRSSGDQNHDRPMRPPVRKNSRSNSLITSSIEENFEMNQDHSKMPIPPPRKKSLTSSSKGKTSRKSSVDILLSEEKTQNFSKIAEDIRRNREIAERIRKLAEDSVDENRQPSQEEIQSSTENKSVPISKENVVVPDRSRRRRRISIPEPDIIEEPPPEVRRRVRSRYRSRESSQSTSPSEESKSKSNDTFEDETPRVTSRMHRKSVKYKSDGLPSRRSSKCTEIFSDSTIAPIQELSSVDECKSKILVSEGKKDSGFMYDKKDAMKTVSKPLLNQKITAENKLKQEENQSKRNLDKHLTKLKVDEKRISSTTNKENEKCSEKNVEKVKEKITNNKEMCEKTSEKVFKIDKVNNSDQTTSDIISNTSLTKSKIFENELKTVKNDSSNKIIEVEEKKGNAKSDNKVIKDELKILNEKNSSDVKTSFTENDRKISLGKNSKAISEDASNNLLKKNELEVCSKTTNKITKHNSKITDSKNLNAEEIQSSKEKLLSSTSKYEKTEERSKNFSLADAKNVASKECIQENSKSALLAERNDKISTLKPSSYPANEVEEVVIVCKLPKKNEFELKKIIPNEQNVVVSIKNSGIKTVESKRESANTVVSNADKIIPTLSDQITKPQSCDTKKSKGIGKTETSDVNVIHTIVLKPKGPELNLSSKPKAGKDVHLKAIPDVIKSTVNFSSKENDISDVVKSTLPKIDDQTEKDKTVLLDKDKLTETIHNKSANDMKKHEKLAPISEKASKDKSQMKQFAPEKINTKKLDSLSKDLCGVKSSSSLFETTKEKLDSSNIKKSSSDILDDSKAIKPLAKPDLIQMTTNATKKLDPPNLTKSSTNKELDGKSSLKVETDISLIASDTGKCGTESKEINRTDCIHNKITSAIQKDLTIQSGSSEEKQCKITEQRKTQENNSIQKNIAEPSTLNKIQKNVASIGEKSESTYVKPDVQMTGTKAADDIKADGFALKIASSENAERTERPKFYKEGLTTKIENKNTVTKISDAKQSMQSAEFEKTSLMKNIFSDNKNVKHTIIAYKKSVTLPNVNAALEECNKGTEKAITDTNSIKKVNVELGSLSTGDVPKVISGKNATKSEKNDTKKSKDSNNQTNSLQNDKKALGTRDLPEINSSLLKQDLVQTSKQSAVSESDKFVSANIINESLNEDQLKHLNQCDQNKNQIKLLPKLKNVDDSKVSKPELLPKLNETKNSSTIKIRAGVENKNELIEKGKETTPHKNHPIKSTEPIINSIQRTEIDKKILPPEVLKLPAVENTSKQFTDTKQKETVLPQIRNKKTDTTAVPVGDSSIKNESKVLNVENKNSITGESKELDLNSNNIGSSQKLVNSNLDKSSEISVDEAKLKVKEQAPKPTKNFAPPKSNKIKQPKIPEYKRYGLFIRPKEQPKTILESSSSEEETTESETETESSSEDETPVTKRSNINGKYPSRSSNDYTPKERSISETSNTSVNSTSSISTICTTIQEPWDDSPKKANQRLKFRKYGVDDFTFLKLLGKGSFGKVLLAELKGTDMYFAIKCLKKDVVLEDDDVESTMIERRVLALGTQHPYMCKLYCAFQNKSYLYFVMEYLNGGDLMFHIQETGRFDERRAAFYGAEIVSALKFLHKRGIVYRDIKLDNLMLDQQGHIRLVDFGMCQCRIYKEECMPSNFCGTPTYIAPEIVRGHKYNQSVDWWSFGVLLYEMLIGRSPFQGTDEDELFWSICNEEPYYPRFLSKEATHILGLLLVKNPSSRLGMASCPAGDIKDHVFFRNIDWNKIENKETPPIFRPSVSGPCDTRNFDSSFTSDTPALSPVDSDVLKSMDQEQFNGFSYTNPHLTA